ncbi:MAG: SusD/RagB family nutrient-binding outer membrane lipoprotein, partial [Ginsengibacter sp.]
GNITHWKEFASGLMLRILMRESNRIDPSVMMQNIVSHPDLFPLFNSNTDQAALQYIADRQENEMPLYRSQSSGYGTGTRITQTFLDELKGINDPRRFAFATPTSASLTAGNRVYKGEVNGTGAFPDPPNSSPAGMLWTSIFFSPDLASPNAAQSVILSYSEVQFTLAEAAEKGFIPGGSANAENYYLNGIDDQFKYYASRIPSNYSFPKSSDIIPPATYYDQADVSYMGTQQQKLQKIWLQKRFALFLSGAEAWSEWRRTGFPIIKAGPQSPGYVPRRCLYPADEMRINTQNYKEAVGWLGTDEMTTHVWWDK